MSFYRNQLEAWLKTISVNSDRAVDIGGASNPARGRVGKWDVDDCVFLDLGKEKPVVSYIPFDLNLPYDVQLMKTGYRYEDLEKVFRFDVLFCLEVFEYIWNPVQAIRNIWSLMAYDSVAYVSFPAVYPVHNPFEIDYLRYTRQAVMEYFNMFGFTQIELTSRRATKGRQALSEFYTLEGMHPLRKSELPYDIGYLVKARRLS